MEFKRTTNAIQKGEQLKVLLKNKFKKEFQIKEVLAILVHIGLYRKGKREKKGINELEKEIDIYLKSINVNPRTAYRWVMASLLPKEYIEQIRKGDITYNYADRINQKLSERRKAELGLEILEMGREAVENL